MNELFPVDNLSASYSLASYKFMANPWSQANPAVPGATEFDMAISDNPNYNTKMYDSFVDLRTNMKNSVGGNRNN